MSFCCFVVVCFVWLFSVVVVVVVMLLLVLLCCYVGVVGFDFLVLIFVVLLLCWRCFVDLTMFCFGVMFLLFSEFIGFILFLLTMKMLM